MGYAATSKRGETGSSGKRIDTNVYGKKGDKCARGIFLKILFTKLQDLRATQYNDC